MSIEKSGIGIYSSTDYTNAVEKLYNIDPIAKGSNFFFGRKKDDGQIIYFPESYRIGYKNFLNQNQVWVQMDFLLVVGLLSDGNWVFLPSYRDGINDAKNELKFAILAEGQRRIFEDNKRANYGLDKQRNKELEELNEENKNIKEELDKQRITAEEYRKEKDEMQRQLKEIQDRLSKMEEDTHNIMKKNEQKTDDLKRPLEKKRGAI
jgi:hypothetical protein